MDAIKDVFDGLKSILNIPKEYLVDIEKNIGTKAILALLLGGSWAYASITGITLPSEFVEIAKAAVLMYITFSATKFGIK